MPHNILLLHVLVNIKEEMIKLEQTMNSLRWSPQKKGFCMFIKHSAYREHLCTYRPRELNLAKELRNTITRWYSHAKSNLLPPLSGKKHKRRLFVVIIQVIAFRKACLTKHNDQWNHVLIKLSCNKIHNRNV